MIFSEWAPGRMLFPDASQSLALAPRCAAPRRRPTLPLSAGDPHRRAAHDVPRPCAPVDVLQPSTPKDLRPPLTSVHTGSVRLLLSDNRVRAQSLSRRHCPSTTPTASSPEHPTMGLNWCGSLR
jgi:hypothetical protein